MVLFSFESELKLADVSLFPSELKLKRGSVSVLYNG